MRDIVGKKMKFYNVKLSDIRLHCHVSHFKAYKPLIQTQHTINLDDASLLWFTHAYF